MSALERLGNLTYMVSQDTSRPLKHLVRLVAPGMCSLDMLPTAETRDVFAYGATLDEAVDRVLSALSVQTGRLRRAYSTV